MNNSREKSLNWIVTDEDITYEMERFARLDALPPDPALIQTRQVSRHSGGQFLVLYLYIKGDDAGVYRAARQQIQLSANYYFGDWKLRSPSGNALDKPPDAEFWHQQWGQDDQMVFDWTVASALGEWDHVRRLAEYLSTVQWRTLEYKPGKRWVDLPDGRSESALRLAIAGIVHGLSLARDLAPLVETVRTGRPGREKHLLPLVEAIESRDPARTQSAVNDWCAYYLRQDCKAHNLFRKVMVEGTFLINYARHLGLPVTIPSRVGDHYFHIVTQ
jgi:hypothetical protein